MSNGLCKWENIDSYIPTLILDVRTFNITLLLLDEWCERLMSECKDTEYRVQFICVWTQQAKNSWSERFLLEGFPF